MPILEALSLGCPVITSNTSSLPEVGGDAALYVEPTKLDSIIKALRVIKKLTLSKRKDLVIKGKKQAKKFTWDKTTSETIKTYSLVSLIK